MSIEFPVEAPSLLMSAWKRLKDAQVAPVLNGPWRLAGILRQHSRPDYLRHPSMSLANRSQPYTRTRWTGEGACAIKGRIAGSRDRDEHHQPYGDHAPTAQDSGPPRIS